MGKRQRSLENILKTVAEVRHSSEISKPTAGDLRKSCFETEISNVYHELGGVLQEFPSQLGKWDINVNGIAVELDEELHFNRYRKLTLNSTVYSRLNSFPKEIYWNYCVNYENYCIRAGNYGGKWTNPSCEKQFGKPSTPPGLIGGGAPRWKQRAFYDYLKDISPLVINVKVARISIWDEIQLKGESVKVSKVLDKGMVSAAELIFGLIGERSCIFEN